MKSSLLLALAVCGLLMPRTAQAVACGQVDDFEDGTTMGWTEGPISPNQPTNVANGGPSGVGDNYLRNFSSGGVGAGSRMVMFNTLQWAGDYLAAGVTRIEADMANFGATALSMRIAIERNIGGRYGSTNAVALPADGQWHRVTFDLTSADLSLISGLATLNDVLANVGELRILSATAGPTWQGDAIVATLGVDNITAVVVGDCDVDGDVDLDDYADFEPCLRGPGGGLAAGCGCADLDCDNDADLRDFAALQIALPGGP
ncbi:MAG: hypothetical protein IID37_11030 [Planctomycetes bacterium]|nr:hypothetical protein [Planctomycetota bacterium]